MKRGITDLLSSKIYSQPQVLDFLHCISPVGGFISECLFHGVQKQKKEVD
jgi:hypothetical protein